MGNQPVKHVSDASLCAGRSLGQCAADNRAALALHCRQAHCLTARPTRHVGQHGLVAKAAQVCLNVLSGSIRAADATRCRLDRSSAKALCAAPKVLNAPDNATNDLAGSGRSHAEQATCDCRHRLNLLNARYETALAAEKLRRSRQGNAFSATQKHARQQGHIARGYRWNGHRCRARQAHSGHLASAVPLGVCKLRLKVALPRLLQRLLLRHAAGNSAGGQSGQLVSAAQRYTLQCATVARGELAGRLLGLGEPSAGVSQRVKFIGAKFILAKSLKSANQILDALCSLTIHFAFLTGSRDH